MGSMRRKRDDQFMHMLVEAKPVVSDPREFLMIIRSSLKSLFGETEAHGSFVEALEAKRPYCIVKCPASSVTAVRAALTCPTPPPYLQSTHYRFDVLQIHQDLLALKCVDGYDGKEWDRWGRQ